jgi:Mg2+ and Co2+ transporter CorA
MDAGFLQDRIAATKAQIIAYEDAAAALASGNIQSYTIDTGQTRQTVTRLDLADIQKTIDSLYNRLSTLQARLSGSGTVIVGPAW